MTTNHCQFQSRMCPDLQGEKNLVLCLSHFNVPGAVHHCHTANRTWRKTVSSSFGYRARLLTWTKWPVAALSLKGFCMILGWLSSTFLNISETPDVCFATACDREISSIYWCFCQCKQNASEKRKSQCPASLVSGLAVWERKESVLGLNTEVHQNEGKLLHCRLW